MPEWKLEPAPEGDLWYIRDSFYDIGLDDYSQAPAQNPDRATALQNVLLGKDGTIRRRWGQARWDTNAADGLMIAQAGRIYDYKNAAGTTTRIVAVGDDSGTRTIKSYNSTGAVQNISIFTITGSDYPRGVVSRGYMYFAGSDPADRIKWDGNDTSGSGTTTWGIAAPSTGLLASSSGSGTFTINFWVDYCYAFYNSNTGHISDISAFTRVEAFSNKAQVDLTSIDVDSNAANTGTTRRIVLRTSDGGPRTRLYHLTTIADNTTTTYTDTTTDATLLNNDVYVEFDESGNRLGILDNSVPPSNGNIPIRHRGRIYLLDGQSLRFSKSIEEMSTSSGFEIGGRYEEAWPADYSIPIGTADDPPIGLLSDGEYLYIGSRGRIYRLIGDGPLTFLPPQIVFDKLGIVGQDVWTLVYRGGVPVGAMWITADLQCILSDFNTYENVGLPVTVTLRTADRGFPMYSLYTGYDQYNLYMFWFRGTGASGTNYADRALIYDLDRNVWAYWKPPSQQPSAMFYWINSSTEGEIIISNSTATAGRWYKYSRTVASDLHPSTSAADAISVVVDSSFLNFELPLAFKWLNAVDLIVKSGLSPTLKIKGASTDTQFGTPVSITYTLVTSQLGDTKLMTASAKTGYRWHQFSFTLADTTTDSTTPIIRSIGWRFVPILKA